MTLLRTFNRIYMKEENAYILGTDAEELHRLGVQHQVWAAEAQKGWEIANFRQGQTILDLGCGPGFCSTELAFLAGATGKVIAVDRSAQYIDYLNHITEIHHLNIEAITTDFTKLNIPKNSLNGMWCRWVLGWVDEPMPVIEHVYNALKPGGKMVIQEYYDWSSHAVYPQKPGITHAINTALKSFKDLKSELNIGKDLPIILSKMGMKVESVRLMSKLGTPNNSIWQWPKTFYETYFPKLVETGYLSNQEAAEALKELAEIEQIEGATLCCPMMVEVVASK